MSCKAKGVPAGSVFTFAAALLLAACASTPASSGTGGSSTTTGGGTGGSSASGAATGSGGAPSVDAGGGGGGAVATGGPDAGDAPPDTASSSTCVTAGAELCDDFESGQLDPQRWKMNKPSMSASITVDDVHVHGGKYALHIKVVPGQQTTAMISEAGTFVAAATNAFYARMFVYFSPEIPAQGGADFHTGFLFGTGNNDRGNVQAGMGMIGGAKQWLSYSIFFGGPKFEFGPWSKSLIAANKWQCVELFEDGSNPTTELRQVWIDDAELTELRTNSAMAAGGQSNHLPPKFDGVSFGLWEYHPIPTLSDMWIDDIRVSSKKIGCAD